MYERNFIYISEEQQEKIKNTKVFLGGIGLGSVIAEVAVRLGFENFEFYDADNVEESNLNRQNYTYNAIGLPKVDCLYERLKSINSRVNIKCKKIFLDEYNLENLLSGCDIAINAIDVRNNNDSLTFDSICKKLSIPVLHPFNFGWAGCLYVITPFSQQLHEIANENEQFELTIAKHTINYLVNNTNLDLTWLYDFIREFSKYPNLVPSQLSVGSHITAGLTANAMFCLANNIDLKTFPDPYFLSTR